MRASLGGWLQAHVRAGRIRDMPVPLLIQLLVGPLLAHVLIRPVIAHEVDLEQACAELTAAFLRAVGPIQPDTEGS